jgi:multiple sugar transport system substrate-binding protein
MKTTRRAVLAAMLAAPFAARAQPRRLEILSHRVHQAVLTQGAAGDLTTPFRAAEGAELAWTTLDIGPLHDRLLREASLPRTDFGVGHFLNSRATRENAKLFAPLDPLLAAEPIEAYDDIAPGLRAAMRVEGATVAIPVRHATNGLFHNAALLEERGIAAPPATLEELLEQCRRLSFRRADGVPVVGLVMTANLAAYPAMFARSLGGDFIAPDLTLLPNRGAMVKSFAILRELYEAGALPRNFAAISNEDQVTSLAQGRAAFAILPFARHAQLNRPDQSRYPGKLNASEFPVSAGAPAGTRMATTVEFWSMAIPRTARDPALAWRFIRAMSAPAVTLGAARNGNGPVRVSTYAEPSFGADNPVAAIEAAALSRAIPPLPAHPEAIRAEAILVEEMQAAVLGRKSAEAAVEDAGSRIAPLLRG